MKKIVINEKKPLREKGAQKSKPIISDQQIKCSSAEKDRLNIDLNSKKLQSFKLREVTDGLESIGQPFNAHFARAMDGVDLVKLNHENHTLTLAINKGYQRSGVISDSKVRLLENKDDCSSVIYESFEPGVDLKYRLFNRGLKEEIVISKKLKKDQYEFSLNIGSLRPVLNNKNGTLELKDGEKTIYRILTPFMEDAAKNRSDDCSYKIEENEAGKLNLTLKIDSTWANADERVYPITVDPTIEVVDHSILAVESYLNGSITQDLPANFSVGCLQRFPPRFFYYSAHFIIDSKTIKQSNPSFSRISLCLSLMEISKDLTDDNEFILSTAARELIRFKKADIKSLMTFDVTNIISAASLDFVELYLYSANDPYYGAESDSQVLEARKQASPTDLGSVDTRFAFKGCSPTDSSDDPRLIIESSDETFDDYAEAKYSVGRAGETFLNLVNGNFHHEHFDAAIRQNTLSLTVSHFFDSSLSETSSHYLGLGWRTNLHQHLIKSPNYNSLKGSRDLIYQDGQGIKHQLFERWYYTDKNKTKKYVDRSEVFLDYDQKLKYRPDEDTSYEVKLEVSGDDGLNYLSGSSLSMIPPQCPTSRYSYTFARKKTGISIDPDFVHHL